ncbi:uncharacterized protein EV422DRAFT_418574 [Fimicolochytrium jonesii]|uniref:uncharacterized protein n=1 Tax=Fimicolochytrium jonesii TaxID=1396493 RepID=UPI0022FE1345|nr:uncharacterized protein EV422DRAFT_418574 [Fimicolochytrium jonesii]KAI8822143.1 hypothetical protein EV422DRAFT_418574 [Fimicolochytrium jonesii]
MTKQTHLPVPTTPATTTQAFPPDFHRKYKNRLPVFVKGHAELRAACTTVEGLRCLFSATGGLPNEGSGGARVNVMKALDGENFLDDERYTEPVSISVEDFIGHVKDTNGSERGRMYYRSTLPESLKALLAASDILDTICPTTSDATEKQAFVHRSFSLARLWVSTTGCVTPLHYDKCHGLLVQLYGRKRFIVFPRDDAGSLYLHNGITGPTHASRVRAVDKIFENAARLHRGDIAQEETIPLQQQIDNFLDSYPKVAKTTPYVIELDPGDILYTPPGYLHEVASLSGSVSVTIPWDMCPDELDDRPAWMAF